MKRFIKYLKIKLHIVDGLIVEGSNIDFLISLARLYLEDTDDGNNYYVWEPIYVTTFPVLFRILLRKKDGTKN